LIAKERITKTRKTKFRKDLAMKTAMTLEAPRLLLNADTAADLMTRNPVSLNQNAVLKEALALFTNKGFTVAPVIDNAGRAVGVLSSSDILVHDREKVDYLGPAVETSPMATADGEPIRRGFQVENVDTTRVADLMTPAVFSVRPDTPAPTVITEMLRLHVHHLFVVDEAGTLVGVISPLDILRNLGY
jgi:CBS domain-containing protein